MGNLCKCCKCYEWAASPDSDEQEKRERWAFWFAGFGSGPDTVNGTWWSVAILALAVSDSICGTNPTDQLRSGADGLTCTPETQWNETVFTNFNGSSCTKTVGLQTAYHMLDTADCQAAMTAYRAYSKAASTEYTCNCSSTNPYVFLGGTGGTRPSSVLSYASAANNLVIAFILPVVGAVVDTTDKRRQVFLFGGLACATCTLLGSILGANMLWVVGLTFTVFTAIVYEIMFVGLAPYLAEIAHTDGGRGKVAGLRQAFSLLAQLTFVLIIGVVVGIVIGANAFNTAIVGNVFCAIWVGVFIPMAYNNLNDRSHSQTRTANMVTHAFSQLFHTFKEAKKYPQTFKFLLMHAFASSGVGSIVTQLATYAVVQLKLPGLQISVLVVLILVCAIPSALLYSYSLAYRFSNKLLQIGTILWFILFVLYFGLVVNGPSSFGVAIPGAMMAGVGFGLWYSLNPAHYMKMIPSDRKAEFVGLYSFCAYLPRFLPPLVYNGFVEGLNDHQIAFLSLILWFVLGLMFAVFIDYEQGALDANASGKDTQVATGGVGVGGAVVTPEGDAAAEVVVDTVAM